MGKYERAEVETETFKRVVNYVSDLVLPENNKPSEYKLYRIYIYLRELGEEALAAGAKEYSYQKGVK